VHSQKVGRKKKNPQNCKGNDGNEKVRERRRDRGVKSAGAWAMIRATSLKRLVARKFPDKWEKGVNKSSFTTRGKVLKAINIRDKEEKVSREVKKLLVLKFRGRRDGEGGRGTQGSGSEINLRRGKRVIRVKGANG